MQQFARDPTIQRLFLAYAKSRSVEGGVLLYISSSCFRHNCASCIHIEMKPRDPAFKVPSLDTETWYLDDLRKVTRQYVNPESELLWKHAYMLFDAASLRQCAVTNLYYHIIYFLLRVLLVLLKPYIKKFSLLS